MKAFGLLLTALVLLALLTVACVHEDEERGDLAPDPSAPLSEPRAHPVRGAPPAAAVPL
jgi:hypothetical protein